MAALDHCVIAVSDWDRSNAFYADVLGAEVVARGEGYVYRLPVSLERLLPGSIIVIAENPFGALFVREVDVLARRKRPQKHRH